MLLFLILQFCLDLLVALLFNMGDFLTLLFTSKITWFWWYVLSIEIIMRFFSPLNYFNVQLKTDIPKIKPTNSLLYKCYHFHVTGYAVISLEHLLLLVRLVRSSCVSLVHPGF